MLGGNIDAAHGIGDRSVEVAMKAASGAGWLAQESTPLPDGAFIWTQVVAVLLIAALLALITLLRWVRIPSLLGRAGPREQPPERNQVEQAPPRPPGNQGARAERRKQRREARAAWRGRRKEEWSRRRGGLVMGWDRRLSTSKTIAWLWTLVLAYMIVTLALIATSREAGYFVDIFRSNDFTNDRYGSLELYLVLLGGPYAAVVLAKLSTRTKVETGRLQKTDGDGSIRPSDLVSNDTGAADLADAQYCLFNLVGLLAVLVLFWRHPGRGLPGIPDFLAILLGGSALTYTVNKAAEANRPIIHALDPQVARVGERVAVLGDNLYLPAAEGAKTKVQVGGVAAEVKSEQSRRIEFTVPKAKLTDAENRTGGWPLDEPQEVLIVTTGGLTEVAPRGLTIAEDLPILERPEPQYPQVGLPVTLHGRYLLGVADGQPADPNRRPAVHVAWTDPTGHAREATLEPAADSPAADNQLKVTLPADLIDTDSLPRRVRFSVLRDGKQSESLEVPVRQAPAPVINDIVTKVARVGERVTIEGEHLSLAAQTAKPAVTVAGVPTPLDEASLDATSVAFRVPPRPGPGWDGSLQAVTVTNPGKQATTSPEALQVFEDIPQLHSPEPSPVEAGAQLALSGRYFYTLGDLDDNGRPKQGAAPPKVRLEWDEKGKTDSAVAPVAPDPAPSDTKLTVTVPANNRFATLPVTVNVVVQRDGQPKSSNSLPVKIVGP